MSDADDSLEHYENFEIAEPFYLLQYFLQTRGTKYFSEWLCWLDRESLEYLIKEMDFLNSIPEHFFTTDNGSLSETAENRCGDVINLINAGLAHDACLTVSDGKESTVDSIIDVSEKIEPEETEEIFRKVVIIASALLMCKIGVLKFTKNKHCSIEKYNPVWKTTKNGKRFCSNTLDAIVAEKLKTN